ncbi:hypothetical protein [Solimonas sp. SE-A11]|uniref:hypothetical protein n=1 Tax=Solimonas sp. SE-A11 TaxID=3054954 RepID=UPI00259C77B3|nr:hypothetical protein [Solimonas sp. SE-A11]MDM4769189.1 hypothetical protein [Solimonas sp. SE-A11]
MRKEYGAALRELFAARMKAEFPAWREVPAPKTWFFPGERLYVRDDHPAAWQVIVLQPDMKDHDSFDIEIGWSRLKRVPELSMRPSLESPDSAEALAREEYICRLSSLIPARDQPAPGWILDPRTYSTDFNQIMAAMTERQVKLTKEQARAAMTPFVDEAFAVLGDRGLSWLESRLAA